MAKTGPKTKYDEKYCQEIIDFMSQGNSKASFAGHIGIHRSTLYDWLEIYPKFKEASEIADAKCQLWWEEFGIQMMTSGQGNPAMWIFNMKNRFPKDWKEKTQTELTGEN